METLSLHFLSGYTFFILKRTSYKCFFFCLPCGMLLFYWHIILKQRALVVKSGANTRGQHIVKLLMTWWWGASKASDVPGGGGPWLQVTPGPHPTCVHCFPQRCSEGQGSHTQPPWPPESLLTSFMGKQTSLEMTFFSPWKTLESCLRAGEASCSFTSL